MNKSYENPETQILINMQIKVHIPAYPTDYLSNWLIMVSWRHMVPYKAW